MATMMDLFAYASRRRTWRTGIGGLLALLLLVVWYPLPGQATTDQPATRALQRVRADGTHVTAVPYYAPGPALDVADLPPPPAGLPPIVGQALPVVEVGAHTSRIKAIGFLPDGQRFYSLGYDKTIRLWHTASGRLLETHRGQADTGNGGYLYTGTLAPDGRTLAVGGVMGTTPQDRDAIRLVDVQDGRVLGLLTGSTNNTLSLAFAPDGQRLVSGDFDGGVRLWDLRTGNHRLMPDSLTRPVYAVAVDPSGQRVVAFDDGGNGRVWDLATNRISARIAHGSWVRGICFLPNGREFIAGDSRGQLHVWDLASGRRGRTIGRVNGSITSVALAPGADLAVVGVERGSDEVVVFDLVTNTELTWFRQHRGRVEAVAISPDGRWVVSGGGEANSVMLWNARTGSPQRTMTGAGRRVLTVGFSADGAEIGWGHDPRGGIQRSLSLEQLAVVTEPAATATWRRTLDTVGKWSVRLPGMRSGAIAEVLHEGQVVRRIERDSTHGLQHNAVTLTPDGRLVISAGGFGRLTAYDPVSGRRLHEFAGHLADVMAIAVSPDGRYLLSGSSDQTVRLWDLRKLPPVDINHVDPAVVQPLVDDSVRTGNPLTFAETVAAMREIGWPTYVVPSSQPLLTLVSDGEVGGEWVAFTASGHYASSPRGDDMIGWQFNRGEAHNALWVSARQLERLFYSPPAVRSLLSIGAVRGVPSTPTARVDDVAEILPPEIRVTNVLNGSTVAGATLTLNIAVSRVSRPSIRELTVFVNGLPVTPGPERVIATSGDTVTVTQTIPLPAAANHIRIESFNGQALGVRELWVFRSDPPADPPIGDLYLLAIGVAQFPLLDPRMNLQYTVRDAEVLAQRLARQAGRQFNKVHTRVIADGGQLPPTRQAIIDNLDFLLSARHQDTVILFLASHGLSDPYGNYYFAPRDTRPEDIDRLMSGAPGGAPSMVPWQQFFDALREAAGCRLLIVDTCESRGIGGTFDVYSLAKRSASSSFGLVTASQGNEESQEYAKGKHGLFTYGLLQALDGKGDRNNDRRVSLSEAFEFAFTFVQQNKATGGKLTPQTPYFNEVHGETVLSRR
jgi:WD40 repeat protein